MNPSAQNLTEQNPTDAGSDVLKLECPSCSGVLNLRRIHIGIEGACVHCSKPVMALDDGNGCRLVSAAGIPDSPVPDPAITTHANPPAGVTPMIPGSPGEELPQPPIQSPARQTVPQPSADSASPWGFPPKKEDGTGNLQMKAAPYCQSEMMSVSPVEPASPDAMPEPVPIEPTSSPVSELPTDVPTVEEATHDQPAVAPPLEQPFTDVASEIVAEEEPPPFSSPFTNPSEASLEAEAPPPLEPVEDPPATPPPLPPAISEPQGTPEITPPSLESTNPNGPAPEVAPPSHPLPGGISPFSTGSAPTVEPGFAESLFKDNPQPEPPAHKPPVLDAPDDAAFNAASQWGPPVAATSDGEELDFSAAIPKPEEAPASAPANVPVSKRKKRKSALPFLKEAFKFLFSISLLGGMAFAVYTFVPKENWSTWKQQAIDWLEPGSVILEKLPFGKKASPIPAQPARTPVRKLQETPPDRKQIAEDLLRAPPTQ